jgi:hypothetical protein
MIVSRRISKRGDRSRWNKADVIWPIGDDIVYGINFSEINSLNSSQREQLLSEISMGIDYSRHEKDRCKSVDFFRKRWISKNIQELEELYSLVEKGITKGYYVSRHTGII